MRDFTEKKRDELITWINKEYDSKWYEQKWDQISSIWEKENAIEKKYYKSLGLGVNKEQAKNKAINLVNKIWENVRAIDNRFKSLFSENYTILTSINNIIATYADSMKLPTLSQQYSVLFISEKISPDYLIITENDISDILAKEPKCWNDDEMIKVVYVFCHTEDSDIKEQILSSFYTQFTYEDYLEDKGVDESLSYDDMKQVVWEMNTENKEAFKEFYNYTAIYFQCTYNYYLNSEASLEDVLKSLQNLTIASNIYDQIVSENKVLITKNKNILPINIEYSYYDSEDLATLNDKNNATPENMTFSYREFEVAQIEIDGYHDRTEIKKDDYSFQIRYPANGQIGENVKKIENEEDIQSYLGVGDGNWFEDYLNGKLPKISHSDLEKVAGKIYPGKSANITNKVIDEAYDMISAYQNQKDYDRIVTNDRMGTVIDDWDYIYIETGGKYSILPSQKTIEAYEYYNRIINNINNDPKYTGEKLKKLDKNFVFTENTEYDFYYDLQFACEELDISYSDVLANSPISN